MTFDYGKLLTDSIKTVWKHKVLWILSFAPMLIAMLAYPLFAIPIFLIEETNAPDEIITAGVLAGILFFMIVSFVANIYFSGGVTLGVTRIESGEDSLSLFALLGDVSKYFGQLFLVNLFIGLTIGLIFSIFFGIVFVLSFVTMGLATICLQPVFILLTPFIFLVLALTEAAHVAVIKEGLSAMEALKKAYAVIRAHVWKFVAVTLIIYFGTTIITSILTFPLMIPFMGLGLLGSSLDTQSNMEFFGVFAFGFMCVFMFLMFALQSLMMAMMRTALGLTYLRLTPDSENQVIFTASQGAP